MPGDTKFSNKFKLLFLAASRNLFSWRLGTFIAISSIALMLASYAIATVVTETLTAFAKSSSSFLFGENALTLAGIWLSIIFLIVTFLLTFNFLINSVFNMGYEVGVWAAVGATPLDIATIAVMEAIILGFLGGGLGYVTLVGTVIMTSLFKMSILPLLLSGLGFQGLLTSLSMALLVCMTAAIYSYARVTRLGTQEGRVRGRILPSIASRFVTKKQKLPLAVAISDVEGLFLFIKSLKKTTTPSLHSFHNFWGVNTQKHLDGRLEKAFGFRCELTIILGAFSDITLTFEQMRIDQDLAEAYLTIAPSVIYSGMASRSNLIRIEEEVREGVMALLAKWRTESKRIA